MSTSPADRTSGAALAVEPADLVAGERRPLAPAGGGAITSTDPAHPDEIVWTGRPVREHVDDAIRAARAALPEWAGASVEHRVEVLRAYREIAAARAEELAYAICRETGKALWDSAGEAKLIAAKVDITLDESPTSGRARIAGFELNLGPTKRGLCRFRPHGVMAVIGPFNFPAHLPNGHIVPALLAGNTVVFKPSDKTPAVGQLLGEMLLEALGRVGAPLGVVNVVQGAAPEAAHLVAHEDLDGILFTGSWPVGRRILEANLDRPGRIVALELGGNNPAVVLPDADLRQAAIECARAAVVTTGQRCTCTRRIIVHESIAPRFTALLGKIASSLIVGDPRGIGGGARNQPVFMGPLINAEARQAVLDFQIAAAGADAEVLLPATPMEHPSGGHYITPGVLRVPRFSLSDDPAADPGCDVEVFGPLVRMSTCTSLDDALEQANATRYGLASAIFTSSEAAADRFLAESRAGCVNVNTGTAGASGKLPFGGLGRSGNHRPAGAFSPDYCAYPVASMVESSDAAPLLPGMQFDDAWMAGEQTAG